MDHISEFILELKRNNRSENTLYCYTKDLYQAQNLLNKNNLGILTEEEIKIYKSYLKSRNLSPSTINRKISCINRFQQFLNDSTPIFFNISTQREKIDKTFERERFNKSDFQRLIKATRKNNDKRAEAIFLTLYLTGMRINEILNIKLSDIDKKVISVRGNKGIVRQVFIPLKLRVIWNAYKLCRIDNSTLLFTGERGSINRQTVHSIITHYSSNAYSNNDYSGNAKVKLKKANARSFRILYCEMLREKGLSPETISYLLGQNNIHSLLSCNIEDTNKINQILLDL